MLHQHVPSRTFHFCADSTILVYGRCAQGGSIHVVLEFMDKGSLADLIHQWSSLEYGEDLMTAVTFQVLL